MMDIMRDTVVMCARLGGGPAALLDTDWDDWYDARSALIALDKESAKAPRA